MSNTLDDRLREILSKAIERAIAGGWVAGNGTLALIGSNGMASVVMGEGASKLIFNHDFAKALWGDSMVYFDDGCEMGSHKGLVDTDDSPYYTPHGENYKYHLQQMVIADNPIAYLGDNLTEHI